MRNRMPCGCREYLEVSRRQFMGTTGAILAALGAPAWLPRVAFAQEGPGDRDILVSIFLRGGADGLTLCVPHGDDNYYAHRPTLNIPRPDSGDPASALDLDGFFGLAPTMAPLLPAFAAGQLAFVHAAGSVDDTRSHFDAMHFMEVGKPRDAALVTGWLGRHLLDMPPLSTAAALRAVGINPGLQRTLVGAPQTLPIPDLADFSLNGRNGTVDDRLLLLDEVYQRAGGPLALSATNTRNTIAVLDSIDFASYVPSGAAIYPDSAFGYALKTSASLIKAQVGVEAIAIDIGGWDTHEGQAPRDGYMAYLMADFAAAVAAFHADVIAAAAAKVTLVAMSEFGRNVAENGSAGTDHGHGNAMLALGANINGGQVLHQWPGLAPEQLFQGQDLAITIDYRDILAEIVQKRLGNNNLDFVFPDYTPTFRGIAV